MTRSDTPKIAPCHPQVIENAELMTLVTRVTPLSFLTLKKKKKERTDQGRAPPALNFQGAAVRNPCHRRHRVTGPMFSMG
jgi:hypothetical protein